MDSLRIGLVTGKTERLEDLNFQPHPMTSIKSEGAQRLSFVKSIEQ